MRHSFLVMCFGALVGCGESSSSIDGIKGADSAVQGTDSGGESDVAAPTDAVTGEDAPAEDALAEDATTAEDGQIAPDTAENDASEQGGDLGIDAGPQDAGPEPIDCTIGVTCKMMTPNCPAPLVPVEKDGCWACGYPQTCSCSDGTTTDLPFEPTCPDGLDAAVQDGVIACVEPFTCALPAATSTCAANAECVMSIYKKPVESVDDCFCIICSTTPLTASEHSKRAAQYAAICSGWLLSATCPAVMCKPPQDAVCVDAACVVAPPPDTCAEDGDCTMSAYLAPIAGKDDCYCPLCPATPLSADEDAARATAWFEFCDGMSCPAVKCAPPPDVVCYEDQCIEGTATQLCPEPQACATEQPVCAPPLVPMAKGECTSGCGYPETCTCSDGSDGGKKPQPICKAGDAIATQNSFYVCVDPITCQPTLPLAACASNEECFMSVYAAPVASTEECYCLTCPTTPLTALEDAERAASWLQHCSVWAQTASCGVVKCAEPKPVLCEQAQCVAGPWPCDSEEGCTASVYSKLVTSPADCYCKMCPTTPLTQSEHKARASAWTEHCSEWSTTSGCQPPPCAFPPPVSCVGNACAFTFDVFEECTDDKGCVNTAFTSLVTSTDECFCPMCPTDVVSLSEAAARQTAWKEHCTGWEKENPCPVPLCLPAPAPVCDAGLCKAL